MYSADTVNVRDDAVICQAERQMLEQLPLHIQSEAIAKVGGKASAVCRLNDRGSGVLISRKARKPRDFPARVDGEPVSPEVGVILTCPWVLPDLAAAQSSEAMFEVPAPGREQREWETCTVRLLPSLLYYSSLPKEMKLTPSRVGYVLVACELYGRNGGTVQAPALPLPITRPFVPSLEERDVCLIIQHPNGTEPRKYHLASVKEAGRNHTVHESETPPKYTSSGGAVFNGSGQFVGIGHMANGMHITINIQGIVGHMFRFGMMSRFDAQLSDEDPNLRDKFTVLGEPRHEEEEEECDGVFWRELWESWYDSSRYGTVVLLLQNFYYHKALVLEGLQELTCHQQRFNIELMSSLGMIDIIVEILRHYEDDADVTCQAVSALGSASEHDANLQDIESSDALQALLRAVREYMHIPRILEWCACVISNLFTLGVHAEASKDSFTAAGGVPLLAEALSKYRSNAYFLRRAATVFASLVEHNSAFVPVCLDEGVHLVLCEVLGDPSDHPDAACLEAVLVALLSLTHDTSLPCSCNAAAELVEKGILVSLAGTLKYWTGLRTESVMHKACLLADALSLSHPPSLPKSIGLGMEDILFDASAACPSSRVLKAAIAASQSIGVVVEHKCMTLLGVHTHSSHLHR